MDFLLDTNFLIGLWRQPQQGPEVDFLEAHVDSVLALPWIASAEFLAGVVVAHHDAGRVLRFLAQYPLVLPDEATLGIYANCYAALRATGKIVGINDLWIAASAIQHKLPLVTRNVRELARVDGLDVFDYAAA